MCVLSPSNSYEDKQKQKSIEISKVSTYVLWISKNNKISLKPIFKTKGLAVCACLFLYTAACLISDKNNIENMSGQKH